MRSSNVSKQPKRYRRSKKSSKDSFPTTTCYSSHIEKDRACKPAGTQAMASFRKNLPWRRNKKGDGHAQPNAVPVASPDGGSNDIQQERSGDNLASLVNHQEPPATQSLWDRAYDALAKKKTELVKDYEMLLAKEISASNDANADPPAQPMPPRDSPSRQAQLAAVIQRGLRRMEETKAIYTIAGHEFVLTDQVTQAAKLLLWAKDWIGSAVQASPQASVAWAGVCLVLPLLTNPTTAAEANLDGFTDVTVRISYYTALEPLLRRLGQNAGVTDTLMSEANNHIVDLYQHILEFQLCSVLRFYQSRARTYVHDMFSSKDWKQAALDIKAREEAVNKDLSQINAFSARQELEALNKTSTDALEVMKGLLSVFTQQLDVSTQHLGVSTQQLKLQQDSVRQQLSNEQKECLQLFYLTKNDNDATYEWYKGRVEGRVPGTCQWFLQHDHYQRWLAQKSGPLLVSADPGCGKSVLAKHLIDHELPQQSATVCYFFFKDQDQNTARQALCALLHQLFSQKPTLIQHAIELYRNKGPALTKSEASLWTILGDAVQDPQAGPVILVLDALDECRESEFKDLIRNVESLFSSGQSVDTKLKILFTSRPYKRVVDELRGLLDAFPCIHIPGEEESETISQEINRVILYRVEKLARKQRLSNKIKSILEERLLKIEHRTYLWVYLVFDHLDTGFDMTSKGVNAAIQALPENVNQAYERILNKSREDPIVQKVLSIILVASRPLTLSEMNVAVRINDQLQSIHDLELEEEESFTSRLRSWCGLFFSIHHGRIYFLHQTAREFLTKPSLIALSSELRWHHSITTRHAHTVLAEICVSYLNMFNSEKKWASKHNDDRGAFLNYSAENWGIHFHDADIENHSEMVPLASRLCDPGSTSHSIWSSIYCGTRTGFDPECFSGLLVASYFGLNYVARLLLDEGADIEAKGDHDTTPLLYAANRGHEAVVRLLLEDDADIEAKDRSGKTPLSCAAWAGHEAVARLLLDNGADVEAKTGSDWTPLSEAACQGHEAVAGLLLEMGADIEARDRMGWTPLLHAVAWAGHEAVTRLLLEKGADVDAKEVHGWTSLSCTAYKGYEAVARVLLENSADIEAKDNDGRTPLSLAANEGHEAVAELLLEMGANVEAKDCMGWTPLSLAADKGHESIARLFLEKGADIEAKSTDSRMPLSFAVDVEAKVTNGRVPLSFASHFGAEATNGRTPLLFAADGGHEAVARLFLENGAYVEAKDNNGRTPLSYAADGGHEAVVQLLLDEGANVDAKNEDGCTPLLYAAERGHEAVVRMLLDKCAHINGED